MVTTVGNIKSKIRKALKNQNTYSKDLETCIGMAAGSYYAFLLAQQDIESLSCTFVAEKSREGNNRLVPHPAFRVLKDASEMTRKSLRELGLTLNTLSTDDNDLLEDLVDAVDKEDD